MQRFYHGVVGDTNLAPDLGVCQVVTGGKHEATFIGRQPQNVLDPNVPSHLLAGEPADEDLSIR
jgi:hypothetical protein